LSCIRRRYRSESRGAIHLPLDAADLYTCNVHCVTSLEPCNPSANGRQKDFTSDKTGENKSIIYSVVLKVWSAEFGAGQMKKFGNP